MGHTPTQLRLPRHYAAAIRETAAAADPEECCGLLVGEGTDNVLVTDVIPTANMADDKRRHFAIDPQAHFDLLRAVRGRVQRVIGHYHSHPNGKREPSAQDLAMANDPEAVWVIVAGDEVRAYVRPATSAGFVEIPVSDSPTGAE